MVARVCVVAVLAVAGLSQVPSARSLVSSPVAVSSLSGSPLSACTSDNPGSQPGINFTSSEVEPYVVVSPTNPENVAAVWQQDRWSNGASRGNVVATSFDGGVTWTVVTATKSSSCTGGTAANGGDLPRASDPWLSFAPNGDLYLATLAVKSEVLSLTPQFGAVNVDNAVLVAKSRDGGLSWSDPVTLVREGCQDLNDKESITADPNNAAFVYAVWSRYSLPSGTAHASCVGSINALISGDVAGAASFEAPAWFARTTDGGRTWERAREIYPVGQGDYTTGHQIVVLPSRAGFRGELLDFFELVHVRANGQGVRGRKLVLIRSPDEGATWSAPGVVDEIDSIATRDPLTGGAVRADDVTADVAIDPRTGSLYAVWKDGRFSGDAYGEIAFAMSTDGGQTWTVPVKVNLTPAVTDPADRQAFLPSVAVGNDGSVGVSYDDFRFNGSDASADDPLETDHFLARCQMPSASEPDRCAGDWTETRLTPSSFNLRVAPQAFGLFLGDYMGLSAFAGGFGALFTQANNAADRASIYFATAP